MCVLCAPRCAAGGYRDILLLQPRVNAVVSLLSDPHLAHIHCWENKMERWEELNQMRRQLALEGAPGTGEEGLGEEASSLDMVVELVCGVIDLLIFPFLAAGAAQGPGSSNYSSAVSGPASSESDDLSRALLAVHPQYLQMLVEVSPSPSW